MEKRRRKSVVMLPDIWDELNEADWRALLKLRWELMEKKPRVTIDDIRRKSATLIMSNHGIPVRMQDRRYLILVYRYAQQLGWLWEEGDDGIQFVYKSTVNLLPTWHRWLGPQSHGGDLVFGEYKLAVSLATSYTNEPNEDTLKTLAGLLYRKPASPQRASSLRVPYDSDTLTECHQRGEHIPAWARWGIYAWFCFFCEYLQTGIFYINGQEMCFKSIFEGGNEKKKEGGKDDLGLEGITLSMASSGVFGHADDVDKTLLLKVMMKLLHDKQEFDKIKKESHA